MFEDSLFATNRHRTPQQRWAALLSFVLQAAFVTVLVGLPLFFTEALPLNLTNIIQLPLPPPGRPPAQPPQQARQPRTNSNVDTAGRLVAVRVIPRDVARVVEDVAPPRVGSGSGVEGGALDGRSDGVIGSFVTDTTRIATAVRLEPPSRPIIVSRMDEGLLIHKVTPVYPHIAQMVRQQGAVVLHAIIGRDGRIQQLQVVSGPPLLIQAAADAVQQWRYKPYILNGQPVEVDTTITVNFRLGQ